MCYKLKLYELYELCYIPINVSNDIILLFRLRSIHENQDWVPPHQFLLNQSTCLVKIRLSLLMNTSL